MLLASASPIKAETEVVTIVDHITSGNSNAINQPEKLLKRLLPVTTPVEDETKDREKEDQTTRPVNGRMAGYRVQVFSDNNVRRIIHVCLHGRAPHVFLCYTTGMLCAVHRQLHLPLSVF